MDFNLSSFSFDNSFSFAIASNKSVLLVLISLSISDSKRTTSPTATLSKYPRTPAYIDITYSDTVNGEY